VRFPFLCAGVAIAISSLSVPAKAACNIRGEFCGYPSWAANAFSHPFDRVPDAWLDNPTNPPAYGYVAPNHSKQRYRKRAPRYQR
jgi:hypothetical protein